MDEDRTVILRPKKPGKPAKPVNAGVQAKANAPEPPPASAEKAASPPTPPPLQGRMSAGMIALVAMALALVGLSTALLTIYIASRGSGTDTLQTAEVTTDPELDNELVAGDAASTEEEDMALITEVTGAGIIELSGDPMVVRQVQSKTRQLLSLDHESARVAAASLGANGKVFRLTDMLENAGSILSAGAVGSQADIALMQNAAFRPEEAESDIVDEKASSTSVLLVEPEPVGRRQEFAKLIKAKSSVSAELTAFGLDPHHSKDVELAFGNYFGLQVLRNADAIAIVAASLPEGPQIPIPMQVSVYREDELVGTVAMGEVGNYVQGADPWYHKDIFAAQLLPEDDVDAPKQRLLDAIYDVTLRNGLPATVAGETIMMMSRVHDLEQKADKADSIVILYSQEARDLKTGFGRVIYVKVTRAQGDLECGRVRGHRRRMVRGQEAPRLMRGRERGARRAGHIGPGDQAARAARQASERAAREVVRRRCRRARRLRIGSQRACDEAGRFVVDRDEAHSAPTTRAPLVDAHR